MNVITLLLLIVAFGCFAVAAFTRRGEHAVSTRVNLVAAGLAAWVLVPLLERLDNL